MTLLLRLFAGEEERSSKGENGTEAMMDPHFKAGRMDKKEKYQTINERTGEQALPGTAETGYKVRVPKLSIQRNERTSKWLVNATLIRNA